MIRKSWIDSAKGFGIVLVVFGHTLRGIRARNIIDESLFHQIDTRIYSFHMPLFFMISGIFILNQIERAEPVVFLKNRIVRLIFPMVLWTYIFLLLRFVAGPLANHQIQWNDILVLPFPGRDYFWFLWALFLLQMAAYFLKPASGKIAQIWIALSVLLASLLIVNVNFPPEIEYWTVGVFGNLPYFAFGMIIGTMLGRLPNIPIIVSLPIFVSFVYFSYYVDLMETHVNILFVTVICISAFSIFYALQKYPFMDKLSVLGRISMAIYLSHTIFSAAARELLLHLDITDPTIHLIIGTAAGVVFPVLLYIIAKNTGIAPWLGFESRRPPSRYQQTSSL